MPIVHSNHCVYDTHYHLVFPVKYRKALLDPRAVACLRRTLIEIQDRYELTIEQCGDDKNHIHLLVSFHPKYSIGQMVRTLKSISARELFRTLPELKRELWGGEFWSDGYYAGTVGTGASWKVVERYVANQGKNRKDLQLTMW